MQPPTAITPCPAANGSGTLGAGPAMAIPAGRRSPGTKSPFTSSPDIVYSLIVLAGETPSLEPKPMIEVSVGIDPSAWRRKSPSGYPAIPAGRRGEALGL